MAATSETRHARGQSVWNIDAAHTTIEFAVKHMMFTTVRGRFTKLEGTIHVDERDPDNSWVEVVIDASSIDTAAPDRDAHLRSADFLDVENHPTITFRSKRVDGAMKKEGDRFEVTGDLTIRGKTLVVTLETVFQGTGKDPWGNMRSGFGATTRLDRRDFGLMWNQALETGGILVGHEVKIEVEAQAVLLQQAERTAA